METLEFTIRIPGLPKTQRGTFRTYFAKMGHDNKWAKLVVKACLEELLWLESLPMLSQVTLICTRASFGTKEPDYDNLVASFKPLIDALLVPSTSKDSATRLGLISSDDNSIIVEREYKWKTAPPKMGYVEIFVRGRIIEESADGSADSE